MLFVTGIPAPLPGAGGGTRATTPGGCVERSPSPRHRRCTAGAAARPGPGVLLSLSIPSVVVLGEEGIHFWRERGGGEGKKKKTNPKKKRNPEGERESGAQQVQPGETSPDPRGTVRVPGRAVPPARRAVRGAAKRPRGRRDPFLELRGLIAPRDSPGGAARSAVALAHEAPAGLAGDRRPPEPAVGRGTGRGPAAERPPGAGSIPHRSLASPPAPPPPSPPNRGNPAASRRSRLPRFQRVTPEQPLRGGW